MVRLLKHCLNGPCKHALNCVAAVVHIFYSHFGSVNYCIIENRVLLRPVLWEWPTLHVSLPVTKGLN